jgi:uroporphyrinogen decarboxylase
MQPDRAANFRELTSGGSPEWIPFTLDIGAIGGLTEPVLERFRRETGFTRPEEYFDYDFRCLSCQARFGGKDPRLHHRRVPGGTTFDEWGVGHWAGGAEATYERMYSPLERAASLREVELFPLPVIETRPDSAALADYRKRGYPVFGYAGSVYEWSWWLRGMQGFLADLLLNSQLAEAILRKVAGYTLELSLVSAEAGIDVLCYYDDAGMQTGLQLSPELWRRFVKPRWAEILACVRSGYPAVRFFLHSCGNVSEIIPDIVELGFHVLHPIQPECMDLAAVRRRFGGEIVLCASISAQKLFPFGSPEEIRTEVARLRALFAGDNRTILCPSNRIQPETPWVNVCAFAEAASARPPARS